MRQPFTHSARNRRLVLAKLGLLLLVLFFALLMAGKASAQTTVSAYPTACTNAGTGKSWGNPANATAAANGVYADAALAVFGTNATSQNLVCTGYNFSAIPGSATIVGITVYVTRSAPYGVNDKTVSLVKAGVVQTTNKSTGASYPGTTATASYGGPSDTWSGSWLVSDVQNLSFGVAIAAVNSSLFSATGYVDAIRLDVTYSTASSGSVQAYPTSCVDDNSFGSYGWSNPGNAAAAPNGNSATLALPLWGTSHYLKCTGYNFSGVPANATIAGVVVGLTRSASSTSVSDKRMRLVKAGVIQGTDKSSTAGYSTSGLTMVNHGSATDLWSNTWRVTDVQNAGFGAALAVYNSSLFIQSVNVDAMAITVYYTATASALDHIEIDHDGQGQTCMPEVVTVKACGDAACTSANLYTTGAVSGNVTYAAGTAAFSMAAGGTGTATVSIPVASAQTVTLGSSAVSPAPTTAAASCVNSSGGTPACSLVFVSASVCFDAVEVGAATGTQIYTKLAGTTFSLAVKTVSSYRGTVQVSLVNPAAASGNCSDSSTGLANASVSSYTFTFGDAGTRTFTFNTPPVAKKVKVRVKDSVNSSPSCSTSAFAIRPSALVLSSSAANADPVIGASTTASPVVHAGVPFAMVATAASGYTGTPVLASDASLTAAHLTAVRVGSVEGSFSAASSATGAATGSFTYDEVGYVGLLARAVYDDTFTADDQLANACTNDFSNTLVGGKYGCKFGNTATTFFGRFTPDHFDTQMQEVTPAAALPFEASCADGFHYSGQAFVATVSAMSSLGSMTLNYDDTGGFAKGVQLSDASGNAVALSNATIAKAAFTNGSAATAYPTDSSSPKFVLTNTQGLTNVQLRALETTGSDGVSSAFGNEANSNVRRGRLRLSSAFGSEKLGLNMPLKAEVFNGTSWETHTSDICSAIAVPTPLAGLTFSAGLSSTASLNGALTGYATLLAGDGGLVLSAPNVPGYVDVTVSAPAWLQYNWKGAGVTNPTARATFGIYRGNKFVVYRREAR